MSLMRRVRETVKAALRLTPLLLGLIAAAFLALVWIVWTRGEESAKLWLTEMTKRMEETRGTTS